MADEEKQAVVLSADRPKTTMSVMEMGRLLGLHKTDSYWLLHRNVFEVKMVSGKYRIDIESFEKWYRNQTRYRKTDGTEPGTDLVYTSYSAEEIGEMLGISPSYCYELMADAGVEYETVEFRRRYKKKSFEKWYRSQNRLKTKEDRDKEYHMLEATMSMPEMARLLEVQRHTVYYILQHKDYKDMFEFVTVFEQKRITKSSFERWYASQEKYRIVEESAEEEREVPEILCEEEDQEEAEAAVADIAHNLDPSRVMEVSRCPSGVSGNPEYYTADEAAALLGCDRKKIHRLIKKENFPVILVMGRYRIHRQEFDAWLNNRREEQ